MPAKIRSMVPMRVDSIDSASLPSSLEWWTSRVMAPSEASFTRRAYSMIVLVGTEFSLPGE